MNNESIYSKVNGGLLHKVVRGHNIPSGRESVSDELQFIQCATLRLQKGHTFKPHKHNCFSKTEDKYIPQESWCVIHGKVKCIFYDIDDTVIAEHELSAGDASFTYLGGHNYLILEDDTVVYEYKTGPYLGQKIDKTFI